MVYKARDTNLDRFVARKRLPAEKVADSERKQRFVQEVKAASSLTTPTSSPSTISARLKALTSYRWSASAVRA